MWNPNDPNDSYTVSYMPKQNFSFSKKEKKDLALSIGIIALVFTIAWTIQGGAFGVSDIAINLTVAFIGAVTGFLLHEMGHKYMAIKYGCWSEFRASGRGLMFALLLSFMGFVLIAPGAVMVSGYVTKQQNGKISAAGPCINMLIGFLFVGSAFLLWQHVLPAYILYRAGVINLFIGGFNLIPISPFDGSKIVKWSIPVYLTMLLPIILFFVLLSF